MFEIDFYTQHPEAIIQQANQKLLAGTEDWEKQVWQFVIDWFNADIKTITVSTSGSTGAPKQIQHTKTAMLHSADSTCKALNLKQGDSALLCLPVNKIAGMMMVIRSIHQKMKLVCIRPSTDPFQDLPEKLDIGFAAFTPMQFYNITNSTSSFTKAGQINKIILGGEDVRAELMPYINKLAGEVYITFGMTETISHIALKKLNGLSPDINFKILPGITISTDARNCLIIEAPSLGQPQLITNDVVDIINKNEFKWLGRFDNVINSGGIKIYPEAIEQQLLSAITSAYFITAKPDEHGGQKLVLVLEKNNLTTEEKELLKNMFNNLGKLHRPKEILLVSHFTRTANGKIKRTESVINPMEVIAL